MLPSLSFPRNFRYNARNVPDYWTTSDELLFVRGLFVKGNIVALRNYVKVAHLRKWWGEGMRVNPMVVIPEAQDLLKEMERKLPKNGSC